SLNAGSVTSTGYISAAALPSITTKGDLNGTLIVGNSATGVKLTVGGNFGALGTFGAPLVTSTITGDISLGGAIISTSNITSLTVKGAILGDVIVDRVISALTAGSATGAVITAGLGIVKMTITGALTNSLILTGLSRGIDLTFGTADL